MELDEMSPKWNLELKIQDKRQKKDAHDFRS